MRRKTAVSAALLSLATALLVTPVFGAETATWQTGASSSWSNANDWTPMTVPSTGDTAILPDEAANNTITYDSGASGALGTLDMYETSGFTNELQILKTTGLTISSQLALSAANGTDEIVLGSAPSPAVSTSLTDTAGIILNAGGSLVVGNTSTITTNTPAGDILNISGGTFQIGDSNTSAYNLATVTDNLSMSSGSIVFAGTGSNRLQVSGTVNITGGSITDSAGGGILQLAGATNALGSTVPSNLQVILNGSGSQTLSTSAAVLDDLTLTGTSATAIKTVTGNTSTPITTYGGYLTFANTVANGTTGIKLGSNFAAATGANLPASVQGASNSNGSAEIFSVDANGYTFDLTEGGTAGVWTPSYGSYSSTVHDATTWSLLSTASGGTIKATGFNFDSSTLVTVNVGSGLTLQSTGGNGTANNLGSASASGGTINAGSTFLYSGSAASTNAATLASAATIGALQVQNGYLNIKQANLNTGGAVTISSGGLSLNGVVASATPTVGTLTLASGQNFTLSGGTLALKLGDTTNVNDAMIGNGGTGNGGNFSLSSATLNLITSGDSTVYGNTYDVFQDFSGTGNTISGLTFDVNGSAISGYTASISEGGDLSFQAIPEPSVVMLLGMGAVVFLGLYRNRALRVG